MLSNNETTLLNVTSLGLMTDYTDNFQATDEILAHMSNHVITNMADDHIKARYGGLLAVAAVTAYEMSIQDIFINFAKHQHEILGHVASNQYKRINGRIQLKDLRNTHTIYFGKKYKDQFEEFLQIAKDNYFKLKKRDIGVSYNNLIQWRHTFVHNATITFASYEEVVVAYQDGKEIIEVLNKAMQ